MPEPQLRYDERSPFIVHMLLLAIIYLAFISLGLPDSLVGAGWPAMHESLGVPLSCAGFITFIIATGTIISSLMSDRLTTRFGPGRVTAASVARQPRHCSAFPSRLSFGCCACGRCRMD